MSSDPVLDEVARRVHSCAVVLAAIDAALWPAEVEVLDAVVDLLSSASRWALVAQLEDGTA